MKSLPFFEQLESEMQQVLEPVRLKKPRYHAKSDVVELQVDMDEPIDFHLQKRLLDHLSFHFQSRVMLSPDFKTLSHDARKMEPYLLDLLEADEKLSGLSALSRKREEDRIQFFLDDQQEDFYQPLIKELKEKLAKIGFDAPIELSRQSAPSRVVQLSEQQVAAMASKKAPAQNNGFSKPSYQGGKGRSRKPKGPIQGEVTPIAELQNGMQNVIVEGHVFDLDNRVTKNDTHIQLISLSDYKDAFMLKRFQNKNTSLEELNELRAGMSIRARGSISYDEFSRSNNMIVNQLEIIKPVKRMDQADTKRVEWHVHSNFSEMDGVVAVEDFVQRAYDWGMPAIAITDHNVIQAFPFAYKKWRELAKKDPERDFKMLYGVEMSMVDDHYNIIRQNDHRPLKGQEYVVFDVETTGLSNRFDRLIEFGAVVIKDNEVIENHQFFIDPKRSIPDNISSLTHIQNHDVMDAGDFASHYQQIKDIFKDRILVAHNASFDVGMINAEAIRNGLEPFNNPYIDTRDLSYALMNLRAYRLENVARHYGVGYDGEGAHRADYDARVLAYVFLHMLSDLSHIKTLDDFETLDQSAAIRKVHPRHISVFAKNEQGIKDLYELITLSHTDYLAFTPGNSTNVTGSPRIPKSVLAEYHEKGNLLFGSSCQNSEIFELARNRSHEELVEAMDFYDFIEIQPPEVYKNLLDAQLIAGLDNLKQIFSWILDAADQAGKPVIASGDVHYLDPHQKRIRDIYINAKRIGNQHHPLYLFNAYKRKMLSAPNQHLLSTKEMLDAFSFLGKETAYEIVVENTRKLADQVGILHPMKDELYPPHIEGSDQKLIDICYKTAKEKYGDPLPEPVEARLKKELDAIISAGYYVVYYISHLLVKKSNDDGYLVGSRGSVGSSFVATMSGITEVNPLPAHYLCPNCHYLEWSKDPFIHSGYDLPAKTCPVCGKPLSGEGQDIPFETFLGFEGDKVPDIDLNFSGDYQANAHAFTKEIFGDDHVFRAGTVGTVQEKTAYGYVKGYEEAMELEPFSEVKRNDLAKEAEGVKRTTGQHPGGIVVVPKDMDIHDFTPVQYPANNPYAEWKTTHFDFHQIHDNILKFDILGHVDPTAMKMLERLSGLDVTTIPMNDPETMKIFSGIDSLGLDTTSYPQKTGAAGIPEFGTSFVRGILESTRPTTFSELVSISGLSHGTDVWLNNAKDLIDQKICELRDVIGCRDDIMLDLIGYGLPSKMAFTIMESVRKGKGLKEEWEALMKEHKVPDWYIDSCKKIKYMFPKAHAVAYVMMAIRIAWFKVHHPLYYYCQFFTVRCDQYDLPAMIGGKREIEKKMNYINSLKESKDPTLTDKDLHTYDTLELALEMTARGYAFSPMNIETSLAKEFCVDPNNPKALLPPFSSVDGLGEAVAESIVKAREQSPFLSKEDLLSRTALSKKLMEKLDELGALKGLEDRNQMALF